MSPSGRDGSVTSSNRRVNLQALRSITSPAISTSNAKRPKVNPFKHETLVDPAKQIRLLRILPESTDVHLLLELEQHDFWPRKASHGDVNSTPPYVAVSYMWGIKNRLQTVLVNGYALEVTANCRYALWQAFRCPFVKAGSYIWVDSICINQNNLTEKAAQVQIMGSIYRTALQVLACTGNQGDDSEYIFEEFEQRAYWERLWIVPELSLANSIAILCGSDSLPLGAVGDSKSFYHGLLDIARQFGKAISQSDDLPMTKLLCSINGETLHRYKNNGATDRGYSMLVALSEFHSWQCTDTRDRVYAFLEVVNWPPRLPRIDPDYTISCVELATRLVPMAMIEGWHIAARRQGKDLKAIFQQALHLTDEQAKSVWCNVDAAAIWKYYCQSGNSWASTGYSEALGMRNDTRGI